MKNYKEYASGLKMYYGISYKDTRPVYLTAFLAQEEAEKWLKQEEGDFRARELVSRKEAAEEFGEYGVEAVEEEEYAAEAFRRGGVK